MKTLFTKLLFVFPALALATFSVSAQNKLGTIDLRKVFDDYYKTKAADSTLKDLAADLEKDRKSYMDQYKKVTDDYKKALDDANNQAVSSDEREKRKKTAESKLVEAKELESTINQFDRTSRDTLEEKQRQAREKILVEIRNVINAKAKAAGFSLVIDTASESFNKTPIILYTNGENDITTNVLAQLNAAAPPGSLIERKEDRK